MTREEKSCRSKESSESSGGVPGGEIGRASGARCGFGGRVPFSPTFESAHLLIPASRKRLDLRRVGRSRRGGQRKVQR